MASLAEAHIVAKHRLMGHAGTVAATAWDRLSLYDDAGAREFYAKAGPLLHGANLQSVALTLAYLSRALGGSVPPGVNAGLVVAGIRNGTTPAEAYMRPFRQTWAALSKGTAWPDAWAAGKARATMIARTDVQLSFRDTLTAAGSADERIVGYQRVADGNACDFCQEVDGARLASDDPLPLHPNCGCSVDPITEDFTPTATPDAVSISPHDELGPTLGPPAQ